MFDLRDDHPTIEALRDPARHGELTLWHVTSWLKADGVDVIGLRPLSYWTSDFRLVDYYCETVRDEGEVPVVFQTTLDRLPLDGLEADRPGLQEPITTVVGREAAVQERYDAVAHTGAAPWICSILAIRSLRCRQSVPASSMTRLPASEPRPA